VRLDEFLTQDEMETGYYDPAEDKFNKRELNDTRKPTLTLKHLNKLKKMRALRTLEKLKREDLLAIMYGQPEEDSGGMGGMPF
jgi:hypothetical protein